MEDNKWLKRIFTVSAGVWIGKNVWELYQQRQTYKNLTIGKLDDATIPTLMLHGMYGIRRSFGGMIERFEKEGVAEKVMEVIVSETGEITAFGQWDEATNPPHPLIHVIFEHNHAEVWEQAVWLDQIMFALKQNLQISQVNMVGHSMGGVATLRYLLDVNSSPDYPRLNKFAPIGSPFTGATINGQPSHPMLRSQGNSLLNYDAYRYFHAYKENIPADLKVLNIYGDLENGTQSDGLVSVASVRGLGPLIKKRIVYYQEERMTGLLAQHSLLHENEEVDRLIKQFLWE